jgi:hypothetical protein
MLAALPRTRQAGQGGHVEVVCGTHGLVPDKSCLQSGRNAAVILELWFGHVLYSPDTD